MADQTGNEPAVPVVKSTETVRRVAAMYRGLTKRQQLAGMAMQGLLANPYYAQQAAEGDRNDKLEEAALYRADRLLALTEQGGAK